MVVGDRGDDEFVGFRRIAQDLEAVRDLLGGADELGLQPVRD